MNLDLGEVLGGLLADRPEAVPISQVHRILADHYDLAGEVEALRSERDQNFRVSTNQGSFVLKISHPAEDPAIVDLQSSLLAHLALNDPTIPVPTAIRSKDGALYFDIDTGNGTTRIVRLLTFLSGTLLHQAYRSTPLLHSLGAEAGRLDSTLLGFEHPARQDLLWDVTQCLRLRPLVDYLAGDEVQIPVARALDAFETLASSKLAGLRAGFIHNDLNPHNMLTDQDRISGILDFGDMVHAPIICELAVAACYHLDWGGEPLEGVGAVVSGYHSRLALQDEEIAILPVLMSARLAISVLITEWRARQDPGNAPYILRNNPASRAGLARLEAVGLERSAEILAKHCQLGIAA